MDILIASLIILIISIVLVTLSILFYRELNKEVEVTCRTDNDCLITHACVDYKCIPGCRDNSGCEFGEVCVEGICFDGCEFKSDCGFGHLCADGICVPGCDAKSDCTFGNICVDQTCVPGCEINSDCGAEENCVDNKCVAKYNCIVCPKLFDDNQKITLKFKEDLFIMGHSLCYKVDMGGTLMLLNPKYLKEINTRVIDELNRTQTKFTVINTDDGGIKLTPNNGTNKIFDNVFYIEMVNPLDNMINLYMVDINNKISYLSYTESSDDRLCYKYRFMLTPTPRNITYKIV